MSTTAIAVLIGLILVNIIKPGRTLDNIDDKVNVLTEYDPRNQDKGLSNTLKEVVLGDKQFGKEGLIPRHIFNTMVHMEIILIIFFSLLISFALSTFVTALKAVNLPTEGIALLLSIDWLLDRFRTATNVWGDGIGAGVVEHLGAKNIYKPKAEKKVFFLLKLFPKKSRNN